VRSVFQSLVAGGVVGGSAGGGVDGGGVVVVGGGVAGGWGWLPVPGSEPQPAKQATQSAMSTHSLFARRRAKDFIRATLPRSRIMAKRQLATEGYSTTRRTDTTH
jgi:hypothetical protein